MTGRRWLALTVRVPSEELTAELAEGLVALGGAAVEQTDDALTTYLPEPEDPEVTVRSAAERLVEMTGATPELTWRWQQDEDWTRRWKQGLAPRRVGRRLVVTQPWNPVDPSDDDLVLVIDPSTAFGTGEHATTRGALRLLQQTVQGGERALDVGTGSGVLAIAAEMLGAERVLAVESDPGAIEPARENLERNGTRGIDLVQGLVDEPFLRQRAVPGYDIIAANVLSGVLVPLLPGLRHALTDGGRLILGGILQEEALAVQSAARDAGLRLVAEDREEEWWTGLFQAQ